MFYMKNICVTLGDRTLEMIDEISDQLEQLDGHKPNRSHVIRMAIATMRKRMSDEGLLVAKSG